ncbi:hypothetical protein [Desulfopila aestuarii]|uniref:VCBS repeat-containing protein n=1 Tax=Desulfopila aestuarii DSM 18488 TaxID=1121416 RepID=A0A1M7Y1I6_9BACT|nr:hypothetical protein [Desulfopila aestuarii]SHO45482.1 hypothetical protein SAMN02745220_01103 [Desulfopila aestuarii DSM 18488]
MIIQDSSIQLHSEHTAIEKNKRMESLRMWQRRPDATGEKDNSLFGHHGKGRRAGHADRIALSQQAQAAQPQRAVATDVPEEEKNIANLNIRILRAMIQRLTGKVMDIKLPQDVAPETAAEGNNEVAVDAPARDSAGFGLEYDYYQSHYEYEATSFNANGKITTADGMQIDFNVQMNMSREFMQEQQVSIRAGDAVKDPLTINYNGSSAELTQTSFAFDIDMDGRQDQIAFTKPGSGFLALDKNEDGQINNGSELFGPTTGSGFGELATYDEDGNGWIDENDNIFDKLRIWSKNSSGENQLFSLGEVGIGAIYLNHISTPFSLKNEENMLLGQVRDTGLFIREDGSVGTVQQIDLAV